MFLKNGAIFIADAHYHPGVREELAGFVRQLLDNPPPQLFLMGDIFDLIVGDISSTVSMNFPLVQLLQELSFKCECYYFEGNHDFNLAPLFPKMKVFPRSQQPAIFTANGKKIALAHGDLDAGVGYELYTALIRNSFILHLLRMLNVNDWIVQKIQQSNTGKNHCKKIENFDEVIQKKLSGNPAVDLVIEGHFHQNLFTQKYVNLPAFCCRGEYGCYVEKGMQRMRYAKSQKLA